jgi:hypothetical protein
MAGFLRKHFRFADVWKNTNWISPNWRLEGNATDPFGWNAYPPSGGSIGAKSIIPDPAGNWWQVEMVKGTSTSYFNLTNLQVNIGGSPAGKVVEMTSEVRVVSGEVGINCIQCYANPSVELQTVINNGSNISATIVPDDGVLSFRISRALAADRTAVWASLLVAPVGERATIRIRRQGCRVVS